MQPTMSAKPSRLGRSRQRQRLGQAAGLVELDVDRVVAAGERRQRGAARARSRRRRAGAGARSRQRRRRRSAGSGCSTSVDAGVGAGGEIRGEVVRRPAFVGVDDQLARGAARRTAAIRAGSSAPPSLILSSGAVGRLLGRRRHRLRRAERDGVGGHERLRRRQAGQFVQRGCPLRLASRSQSAQSSALRAAPGGIAACRPARSSPPRSPRAWPRSRRDAVDASRRSAHRARIRRGRGVAVGQLRDDDRGLGLGAAAMVKAPAIGQRSIWMERRGVIEPCGRRDRRRAPLVPAFEKASQDARS